MLGKYRITGKEQAVLKRFDPDDTGGFAGKEELEERTRELRVELARLQEKLFAQKRNGVLFVFQGMDCSGKDGVINHVMAGINPQGMRAVSFKRPTSEEAAHDFLWRAHRETPARGYIAAFNRSYYEDVLVTRVHGTIDDKEAERRIGYINQFEKLLASGGVTVVKLFLHISRSFQREKLKSRLGDPDKHWKFDPADVEERKYWRQYEEAYEDVFRRCASKSAPWYIVPADNRWYRDYVVLSIVVRTLAKLEPAYPGVPELDVAALLRELDADR
ncbi:PPK2 family polyphosphate kinase [Paenibacillus cymbidii]|uniref:PPK2 family polyphosphate kinase n=1 Tax=Paenibacillus cymbidii TaxID=1639034 RepID=UPI001080E1F7|nr:PPK2 family polyphosphate kinase [Paenibacillus cymbidii]